MYFVHCKMYDDFINYYSSILIPISISLKIKISGITSSFASFEFLLEVLFLWKSGIFWSLFFGHIIEKSVSFLVSLKGLFSIVVTTTYNFFFNCSNKLILFRWYNWCHKNSTFRNTHRTSKRMFYTSPERSYKSGKYCFSER